jgi:hypothetical protein
MGPDKVPRAKDDFASPDYFVMHHQKAGGRLPACPAFRAAQATQHLLAPSEE